MNTSSRILVVDDEEGLRQSLAANLELEGYEVHEARSGADAIELAQRMPFDLVITDVRMPGMNGVETFHEIRRIQPGISVVMMTAFTLERIIDQALAEGVYAVIHKPFSMPHVLGLIARAVDRRVILVVDDVPEQASSIVGALAALGLRAEAVNDGLTAVRLVHEGKVDVCVLDLVMPSVDGVATYEMIRRLDPSIAVVAISGYSVPEMMHKLMRLGGYACLRKPFAVGELVRAIARARGESARGCP